MGDVIDLRRNQPKKPKLSPRKAQEIAHEIIVDDDEWKDIRDRAREVCHIMGIRDCDQSVLDEMTHYLLIWRHEDMEERDGV